MGFSSSNDRAIIPLLKRLEFLLDNGAPTEYFNDLKDKTKQPYVLGERIKSLYSDLYAINTNIHDADDDEIKGAISRVTGKDKKSVNRYFATFKTLTSLAKFEPKPARKDVKKTPEIVEEPHQPSEEPAKRRSSFHYNIQVHLPATTDISVYNAIFKSLKDNLLI